VVLFGTDQRITSGPGARRLHSKAGYMAAPERFADLSDSSCTAGAVHTWTHQSADEEIQEDRLIGPFATEQQAKHDALATLTGSGSVH
jgi:hypothetical protein